MRLYLDDDSRHGVLTGLLRKAAHDVLDPGQAQTEGENDPIHFIRAILDQRVLVSKNHDDFEQLHELVLAAGGHHPGIMIIRQDNDRSRDLTPRGIVVAIRNFELSRQPIQDSFVILNHWR